MSFSPSPQPLTSAPGEVTLVVQGTTVPLRLATNPETGDILQYQQNDPERFADKISIGDLKYSDFNPYENAHMVGQFDGGYGLNRYADLNDEAQGVGAIKESTGVDCRFGPAFLAPLVTAVALAGSTSPPVWAGEFTPSAGTVTGPKLVVVAGTKLYYSSDGATFIDTGYALPFAAVQGAVTVVGGQLIIGFGSAGTARYTTSLDGVAPLGTVQDTGAAALFVFAATTDRASVYIAGGTAATNSNQVLAAAVSAANPAQAFGLAASGIICGGADSPITSLAPGGGLVLLFVAKTVELGEIAEVTVAGGTTPSAVYKVLLPFDSRLSTNGVGMKWWMGTTSNAQRGPTILVFGRDRSPWIYAPSSDSSGSANNIATWAKHGYHPPNIVGRPTAFQGTARWLYYTITRGDGRSYLLCYDSSPQPSQTLTQGNLMTTSSQGNPTHSLIDLGVVAAQTMTITSLFGTNPLLFFGNGNGLNKITLPLDGENPLDDANRGGNCRFGPSGTLDMPDIDHNFPDEDKVEFTVRMVHDGVNPGAQDIAAWVALDGGAYTRLGNALTGNATSVAFATNTVVKRVSPRFILTTTDPTKTPVLMAFSIRASINNVLYREWLFVADPVQGAMVWGGEDRQNVYAMISNFWAARRQGFPLSFTDPWGDTSVARLLRFKVQHLRHLVNRTPEVRLSFHLLEVAVGPGNSVYGNALAVYGAATSRYA